jgi:hypothetical protein
MNFMRKRGEVVGDKPGASLTTDSIRKEGKIGEGTKVWGAFFGQSSLSKRAVVARASVSVFLFSLLKGSRSGLGDRVVGQERV